MRIDYIDGLRGLFAILVVISHYSLFFYEIFPEGFRNSSGSVCGFFIITGFILSFKFWQDSDNISSLTSSALRRYVRLTTLPFVSVLIAYFLIKYNLTFFNEVYFLTHPLESKAPFYNLSPNFFNALYEGMLGIYFSYNQSASYNPVLWTMAWELEGSMLVFAFLALLFGRLKNRLLLYAILIAVNVKNLYLPFFIGVMFADMIYSEEGKKYRDILIKKKILSWFALFAGIVCYFYAEHSNWGLYHKMHLQVFFAWNWQSEPFYHTLGAAFLIYSVIQLKILQKVFDCKFFTFVGKHSFSIYVLHVITMISSGGFVFLNALNSGFDLHLCIIFGTLAGIVTMIFAIIPLHFLVNLPTGKLARRFEKIFK